MSKSSKSDLLVRVRYQNPLPPPPFPPRLLNIDTTPTRYASYEFLKPLARERELPLVIDGELGLPLELGKIASGSYGDGAYWDGDRSKIAPTTAPPAHDDDLFLQGDASASSSFTPGSQPGTPITMGERKKVDVSWLRRTEYLSSDPGTKAKLGETTIKPQTQDVEVFSRDRRVATIAATFAASSTPLADLKHPTKKGLTVVESFDVLPDEALYANNLSLVRFGEDPGESKEVKIGPDARLPRAVFRPVEVPGEGARIGYFLPQDEDTATAYEKRRRDGPEGAPEDEAFDFKWIRDYEVANRRALGQEFIFTFAEDGDVERPGKRAKGVYFAALQDAQTLRKRRVTRNEDPREFPAALVEQGTEFWDGIAMAVKGMEAMDEDEAENRKGLEREVMEPPVRLA
ncbi:Paf1 family protein [Pseudohyphozyma bogoriensis]|nr:Paf1 family protein [Pseudohyphozyma bogoriensis]